ncbi:MAG TPA: bestrophin family ion channel [Chitinophagaceae bacterium]|nr:bestrophin family ion channel [Chitinophagaceae bacterium]
MYIGKSMSIPFMWAFAKKNLIRTLIISVSVVALYDLAGLKFLAIPFLPLASIGTAVAFYVGFKNNSAYDRLWEARKLWGGITNTSRSLTASFISLIEDKEIQQVFLMKHIAYINILRLQLRKTIPWATSQETLHQDSLADSDEINEYNIALQDLFTKYNKTEIYEKVKDVNNLASYVLRYQFAFVTKLKREGKLDEYEHSDLTRLLGELYNLQGGCERIKTTPLFRQYSVFSRIFVTLFNTLLPFGMLSVMKDLKDIGDWTIWLTLPFSLLISWVFYTMEQIGEYSENPFDNGVNDIPISSICRNIEIDILEMLGESDLPEKIQPYHDVLL